MLSLRVVKVKVCLAPHFTELFQSLLPHQHHDDLTVLFHHILEDLLIDFVDEDFFVDIILRFLGFTLGDL